MFKWKVAFLYQDRKDPVLFPVFSKNVLFHHYRAIDPSAKLGSTPHQVMYETLLERHRDMGDVFAISAALMQQFAAAQASGPRAWAVPLSSPIDTSAIELLCAKAHVEPEDIDSSLDKMLSAAELAKATCLLSSSKATSARWES